MLAPPRLDGRAVLVGDGDRAEALARALAAAGARVDRAGASDGDALVLFVAAPPATRPLVGATLAQWDDEVTRPLRATALALRDQLGAWIGDGVAGAIVLVHAAASADAGVTGRALVGAVEALARSVAKEYGRKQIRCNAIALGADARDDELAAAVTVLLCPASSFVNGALVAVGGRP